MTTDIWNARDLPVLRTIIDLYETNGGMPIVPPEIEAMLGFDADTVQRSLRALDSPPSLFDRLEKDWDGQVIMLGRPTARALQVAGAWPSPENLLDQLIGALNAAAGDDNRAPEDRMRRLGSGRRSPAATPPGRTERITGSQVVKFEDQRYVNSIASTSSISRLVRPKSL